MIEEVINILTKRYRLSNAERMEFARRKKSKGKKVITNKELLNNDIIAKLTKNEIGNILKVGDEAIFETTFKKGVNNAKAAKEVYDVVSRSPEALKSYKNSIFSKYKADVLDPITNKPNLVKHNAFIKNYEKISIKKIN